MLWVTTILTLIPRIICQPQNGNGFVHYDNTNSLSGAHIRISELEKRYVDIEKRWETYEILMNDLKKQRLLDLSRIAHLEKYHYIDRKHIFDLSKHLYLNQYRMNDLEKQIQAHNRRIADLENQRQADKNRIADLEQGREADSNRIGDLEKGREADRNRIGDLEKGREADRNRIGDLEKGREAGSNRIGDLEKGREGDSNRIGDLEKEKEADSNRIGDLEKERQADNQRIADLDQQLRILNHVKQSEFNTNDSKLDALIDTDIPMPKEELNAKQQQHVTFVSEKQRWRDTRQLTRHLKTNKDVIEEKKRVATKNDTIAFHAFLTHSYATPNELMELHFDRIVTNTGSAYDGNTGTFTCTRAGLYVFHWEVHISGGWITSEVVRNGVQVGTAFSGVTPPGTHTSGGGMTAVQLSEGDRVWVRLYALESHEVAVLPSDTRFTGFLLK